MGEIYDGIRGAAPEPRRLEKQLEPRRKRGKKRGNSSAGGNDPGKNGTRRKGEVRSTVSVAILEMGGGGVGKGSGKKKEGVRTRQKTIGKNRNRIGGGQKAYWKTIEA